VTQPETENKIRLDSPAACRGELERVSNALALLTQEYSRKRERLGELEQALDHVRAVALTKAEGANKEEREARVLITLNNDERSSALVKEEATLKYELEILSQRIRTLEKRGTHAQSANRSLGEGPGWVGAANL
jgi:hypothetical protein